MFTKLMINDGPIADVFHPDSLDKLTNPITLALNICSPVSPDLLGSGLLTGVSRMSRDQKPLDWN